MVSRAQRRGASTIVGVLPEVLAASCASCGAGVLGALGFVGAMAALPHDGNLLRAFDESLTDRQLEAAQTALRGCLRVAARR